MKNTIITIITLALVLMIILLGSEKIFNKKIIDVSDTTEQQEILPVLEIKEQYDGATYTFAGTIDLPNLCYQLDTNIMQLSDSIYEIQITTIAPDEDVICAQVITPQAYLVSFDAPEDIEVFGNINGQRYELFRFRIPNEEDITSFELFIKG